MKTIRAVDLFAGAGGTSTGLAMACKELGLNVELTAVNHWPEAIVTHERNHPWAKHICANIDTLDPRDIVPGGKLDILVASPECTHFSVARGGRPVNDQLRASAWQICRWLELLSVNSLLVENVPEFRSWGPVNSSGRPVAKLAGETFRAWLSAIRSFGYNVDYRVLNAADYGDATSRRRLFIIGRKGKKSISWPPRTHSKDGAAGTRRWRAAREIIDWSVTGKSIFARSKPLSSNTMRRIVEGLRKFGGEELRPFLILMEHGGSVKDIETPLPVITTAKGGSMGIVEPFILIKASHGCPKSTDEPVPTILAGSGHHLVEPFLVRYNGEVVHKPKGTVDGIEMKGSCEPFLTTYYRNGGVYSVDNPAPVVTTKDRLALVMPSVNGTALDIRFRMLEPRELSMAMGFPENYEFEGGRTAAVKQIGNAVAVGVARALCRSLLGGAPSRMTLTNFPEVSC